MNGQTYQIRKVCGTKQRAVLEKLDRICFPHDEKARTVEGHWWIAYCGDEPVAFGGIKSLAPLEEDVGLFTRAGVIPEHRGRGLQARLIRIRLRFAKKHGWGLVLTSTYDNPPSANNLIRQGFLMYDPSYRWMSKGTLYWIRKIH